MMKLKQSLSPGIWEVLIFMIIASTAPVINGGEIYVPQISTGISGSNAGQLLSLIQLDYVYYQFFVTVITMAVFVLKVIVFDFGWNLEGGVETSYLLLPVKRSRLLLPIIFSGVVLPYWVASASVFYALALVHFHLNLYSALTVALLDFLPLLLVCSISMLVAMKTKSTVSTLGVAIALFFFLGIFLGLNIDIAYRMHSPAPLLLLGILFPAASMYDYFTFGSFIPGWFGIISTPGRFLSVFPWLVAGSVILNILLLAAVFWYWGHRFQISG